MTKQTKSQVNWNISTAPTYFNELTPYYVIRQRTDIQDLSTFNFKCWEDEFPAKMSIDALLTLVRDSIIHSTKIADSKEIRRMDLGKQIIEYSVEEQQIDIFKIFVSLNEDQEDYYDESDTVIGDACIVNVTVSGIDTIVDDFVCHFRASLKKIHAESKTSLIRWIFDSGHGHRDRTFQITKEWSMDRSYYPWIETELKDYYQSFMNSRAQILVLYGAPGTGKTSFIRDMICEMNLNAFISYDLKVLTSDSTFVRYLTDSIFDAVIIEDADDLLTSSRGDHNKVIAKILNISDGIIKLPKKKLIFSTNLRKIEDIDTAIIRPGRCFDVMEFRELTKPEALIVADKIDVDLPDVKNDKYSLAEIFYELEMKNTNDPFARTHGSAITNKKSVGFV